MNTKHVQSILKFSAIVLILTLFFIQCSTSKKTLNINVKLNADDVKNMVDNRSFIFIPNRVYPLRGKSHILTTEYDVTLKNDSLVSYLPYFGRAYQAPLNPTEGGIQFTSTNFSYVVNPNNKKGWDVIIKPKDFQEVQQFYFRIFENGIATLNVISTYKDPISFNGYLMKVNGE